MPEVFAKGRRIKRSNRLRKATASSAGITPTYLISFGLGISLINPTH